MIRMNLINSASTTRCALVFIIFLITGCSIPDRDAEVDACIAQKKGISNQIIQSCKVDPIFTDCAITEGDQTIGSGCTRKYKDKTKSESEKICIDSVSGMDFEILQSIVRTCLDENSEDSIQMRVVFAYVTNFVLLGGVLGLLFPVVALVMNGSSGISRPRKGSRNLTVSSSRETCDNAYSRSPSNPKDSYVESERFDYIILNCRDIKKRQHICKSDYQTFFRELGVNYLKHYDFFGKKLDKEEVVDLLNWAISAIPSVYKDKSHGQGVKRKDAYLECIESINKL